MKFTQTSTIETELPPEADVADFVNGDGDNGTTATLAGDRLEVDFEHSRSVTTIADSPSLDVDSEIDNVLKQEEQDRRISSLVCEVVPAPDGSTTDPPLPPLPPIEEPDGDDYLPPWDSKLLLDLELLAKEDPEFGEIVSKFFDDLNKWEDQCTKIRWSHRMKLDDLKSEIVILSKKIEDLRQLTKEAKSEYKQCLSDLMDGEKKGPELPKKPECITYERFLELKDQAKDNPNAPPITLATATQSPNQDEEWKAVPTSRIFEGKTIKGLGKKKIEAVCDVAPTIGELEELRNQASLKHLHFCKMLPKGIGEELADAIQDLMYPHTYPNSKGTNQNG